MIRLLAFTALVALLVAPASAHHSGAMFDRNKEVSVTGFIKEVQWTNPHAWIEIMAEPDASGKVVQWGFEFQGGPGSVIGLGITRTTLKVGDKVTIVGHPLRDGRPGGHFRRITLPDGRILPRAPTAPPVPAPQAPPGE